MKWTRFHLNGVLLTGLGVLASLLGFLLLVQVLLIALSPPGSWHAPRIYRVTIRDFQRDPQSPYATLVIGQEPKDPGDRADDPETPEPEDPKTQADPKGPRAEDLEEADEDAFQDLTISLSQEDGKGLRVGDRIWVLDNVHRTRFRPAQFRLTPARLLVEFPEPALVLAVLLILALRKARARALKAQKETPRARTVLRDDFHARAERFSKPEPPGPPD